MRPACTAQEEQRQLHAKLRRASAGGCEPEERLDRPRDMGTQTAAAAPRQAAPAEAAAPAQPQQRKPSSSYADAPAAPAEPPLRSEVRHHLILRSQQSPIAKYSAGGGGNLERQAETGREPAPEQQDRKSL